MRASLSCVWKQDKNPAGEVLSQGRGGSGCRRVGVGVRAPWARACHGADYNGLTKAGGSLWLCILVAARTFPFG